MIFNNDSVKRPDDRKSDQAAAGGPVYGEERCDDVNYGRKAQRQREQIIPTDGQEFILRHSAAPF